MFTEPTVFILGAGASWHYGYPTGEELVNKVIEKATYLSSYFDHSMRTVRAARPKYVSGKGVAKGEMLADGIMEEWRIALFECKELKAGLEQVRPLVIDYYLGWNPRFQDIGRLLIAWVIIECEQKRLEFGGNINRSEMLRNSPYER
jgi:hypothetical protein